MQEDFCARSKFLSSFAAISVCSQHHQFKASVSESHADMFLASRLSLAVFFTRLFIISQAIESTATNDSVSVSTWEYWHCFSSNVEAAYLAPLNDCQKMLLDKKLPKRAIMGEYQLF